MLSTTKNIIMNKVISHIYNIYITSPFTSFLRVCQSKECNRVTDWLKHSLQAIVVYVKYFSMFQNDHKRLGHSVICSIDYWLLHVNRKIKWYWFTTYIYFSKYLKCETQPSLLICFMTHFKLYHATHASVQCTMGKYCEYRSHWNCIIMNTM
jgi:hypothetical protein